MPTTVPSQPHDQTTATLTTVLFFTFNINYWRYSILNYKTDFLLDDFAQLQANVKCSEHV